MRKKQLLEQIESIRRESVQAEINMAEATAYMQTLADETKSGGWESLDASATKRNRSWADVEANLKECYAAWCVNPLAKSFCDYMRYFCIGQGTQIEVGEKEGDDAADRIKLFCEVNKWALLEKKITEELSRDGEVFVRYHDVNRNKLEADVAAVSLVDPLEIPAIDCPEVNSPKRYFRKYKKLLEMKDDGTQQTKDESEWIDTDFITHLKVNTSYNELRGRSDLLVMLPTLRQLKRWLTDMSRRNYMIGAFVWDVTCKAGRAPSAVTAKYPHGPLPASVIAHGENEIWEPQAPDLRHADSTKGARMLKLNFCAAAKMPESWFGDTGESNLATTEALSMPTTKQFTDRQDTLKFYFEEIIKRGARVEDVTVTFPEIVVEEAKEKALALKALSDALINFQDGGVMSRETGFELVRQLADLDAWDDDESGAIGEKKKIEDEETEDALATAQGRRVGEKPRPALDEVGEPRGE